MPSSVVSSSLRSSEEEQQFARRVRRDNKHMSSQFYPEPEDGMAEEGDSQLLARAGASYSHEHDKIRANTQAIVDAHGLQRGYHSLSHNEETWISRHKAMSL